MDGQLEGTDSFALQQYNNVKCPHSMSGWSGMGQTVETVCVVHVAVCSSPVPFSIPSFHSIFQSCD